MSRHDSQIRIPPNDPRMDWWRNARFGMFIHWGLFTHGAGDDNAGLSGLALRTEYDRRLLTFSAPAFDADAWAKLAADAGARYVVLVSRHADGFCLWPSRCTEHTVARTPLGVDVVGKLAEACRGRGLRFGTYLAIPDLRHPDWPRGVGPDGLPKREPRMDRFAAYLETQVRELIEGYRPSVLWFDGDNEAPWTHEYGLSLYRTCRSLDPNLLINNRVDKGRQGIKCGDGKRPEDFGYKPGDDIELYTFFRTPRPPGEYAGDFATPEQSIGAFDRANPWETCMTLGRNWTWAPGEELKTAEQLVAILVRCAGGDGNFLLNIAPRADGGLDSEQADRMRGVGAWLSVNGDAIYGTRGGPWMPGTYGASTCAGRRVNVLVLDRTLRELRLPALPLAITACRVNGVATPHGTAEGSLRVTLPPAREDQPVRVVELQVVDRGDRPFCAGGRPLP